MLDLQPPTLNNSLQVVVLVVEVGSSATAKGLCQALMQGIIALADCWALRPEAVLECETASCLMMRGIISMRGPPVQALRRRGGIRLEKKVK